MRDAMYGQTFPNLTGGTAEMLVNHHLSKPVLIGEIQADGQFDIISQTAEVPGDAWTDFLPESAVLKSDWKEPGLRDVQHRKPKAACRSSPTTDPQLTDRARSCAGPIPQVLNESRSCSVCSSRS